MTFITEKENCIYGIFILVKGGPPFLGGGDKAYLIVEWEKGAEVNKTDLQAAINNAPESGYYTSNDRYNGNDIYTIRDDTGSFWADMQKALTEAQGVNENASATQTQVDDATNKLTTAIAKLIPTTQVNATALYEALQNADHLYWYSIYSAVVAPENFQGDYITQNDTSVVTWSPLQTAITGGQNLLSSLYNSAGAPTDANTSTDTDLVASLNSSVTAINDAIANLDKRTSDDGVENSRLALQSIDLYANTLYNPDGLTEKNYTPDSWSAFTDARTAALAVLESGKSFAGMGERVVAAQNKAFTDLRSACYGLTETKSEITVHFSAVDSYAVRKSKTPMAVNTCDLTLTPGQTIADALTQAGVTLSTNSQYDAAIGVYLNGVFLTTNSGIYAQFPASNPSYYNSYALRDGDTLTAVLMTPPLYTNLSGSIGPKAIGEIGEDYLRHQTISLPAGTQQAGAAFAVTVTSDGALASGYAGTASPVQSSSVYVSAVCETEEAARTAAVTKATGVVTGSNGVADVTLYSEGWYALNAFNLSENGGLTNGQTVLVHVGAATDADAVKSNLKAELNTLAAAYPENFYTPENWQTIQDAKATALAEIDGAGTTGDAYAAQQTAVTAVTAIQTAAAAENASNLQSFRSYMNQLPEDLSKLDQSAAATVTSLISRYERMTGYQREQLTQLEINTYEAIKTLNTEGLPEATAYQLKVEYDLSGVPEADRSDVQAMLTYLQTNTAYEGKNSGDLGGEKMAGLYSFNTTKISASMGGTVFTPITSAYGGTKVSFCQSPEYASHMLIRGQRNYTVNGAAYNNTNYSDTLSDGNWSIKDVSTATLTDTTFALNSSRVYTVNGNTYEMRGMTVDSVSESALSSTKYGFFDFSDYLGKSPSNQTFISIGSSFTQFVMPYQDVTVTVQWAPAGGTDEEISAAKTAAKSAVETAYAGYSQSDYSMENWTALTEAKTDGLAAIEAATSVDAVKAARQAALAAMAAVKRNTSGGSTGSTVDLPDYGKTVGQVYVSVENNTYSGGDFTGTILSGWYDLCAKDTMMTSILKALKTEGYAWTGTGGSEYGITYLASISKDGKKLGEFDGEPGSGWMGTLNDWFTNEGFSGFGVENGKLENGDIISVVYTQNLGVDVGGTWGNSDTSLSALKIAGGTLTPSFNGDTLTYSLTIPGDTASVTVTPTAANKNYLVKTFLNTYNSDAAFYKRTETISVKSGDMIYVGVGEKSWPSMNNQGDEARDYTGTKYTIKVYSGGKDGIQAQINALPDAGKITLSNYKSYQSSVSAIRKAYDALSDKSNMTITRLTAAEEKITFFSEIDNIKTLLAAIPAASSLTTSDKSKVSAARTAYDKLSSDQKLYITISDVTKYNAAVEWLEKQGISTGGSISGSQTAPGSSVIEQTTSVSGSTATATVTDKAVTSAIEAVKDSGETAITIVPTDTGSAKNIAVTLPKTAAQSIVDDTNVSLVVETAGGNVTIPNGALKSIASQAGGSTITITVEQKTAADVEDKSVDTTDAVVVAVTVQSGDKPITSFGGKSLTITIPVTSKFTEGQSYKVIEISADGTAKTLTGKCVKAGGKLYVQVSTTGLSTFVATTQKAMLFNDVSGHWALEGIQYAYNNGLFSGTSDTTFSPDTAMTRAMLVTVLYRMEGSPAVTAASSFADVKAGQYYTDAVIWANANGIVGGYGKGLFGTNDSITREQLAAILYRYAQYKKYDTTQGGMAAREFSDYESISSYATEAMTWAVNTQLLQGSDGKLMPAGTATRAQVATILMRFAENAAK